MKQPGKRSKLITFGIFGVIAIGIVSAQISSKQHKRPVVKSKIVKIDLSINKDKSPLFLDEDTHWADSVLATLTLEQKIAQFFMVAAWSSDEKNNHIEIETWIKQWGIGGVIFFQGDTKREIKLTNQYQKLSKVPLMVGIDGEWGPAMRLTDCERYPYQLTMGATQNADLIKDAGYWIGRECQAIGIHINFAPDVDVNSNPRNPVINYRSFGEDPTNVANLSGAFVEGMENSGVLSCAKHFPGHGDTDKDSHLELPLVNHTLERLKKVDFVPFEEAIHKGTSSIMVAHLNVPSLDSTGIPTSLSSRVIKKYLQDTLEFKGLIISDALNMKGVADIYGKTEVVVKAFIAGNDILLFPESVSEAIVAISQKVKSGKITEEEIDRRCKKVLLAKYWALKQQAKSLPLSEADSIQIQLTKQNIANQSITILQNKENILPLKDMSPKTAIVLIGKEGEVLKSRFNDYMNVTFYQAESGVEALALLPKLASFDRVISVLLSRTVRPIKNYGFPEQWTNYLSNLRPSQKNIVLLLGNPYALTNVPEFKSVDALVLGYENSNYIQDAIVQVIVGALPAVGKLPVNINDHFCLDDGIQTEGGLRLQFTVPEAIGVKHRDLDAIDSIALDGVTKGAYPGCQVFVAVKGKVIFRKNYGNYTYDKKQAVSNGTVYDLASITKIAASTLSMMYLDGKDKFSLDSTLNSYLPELVKGTPYQRINLRDMLAHQAGFIPWIPFYLHVLQNGTLRTDLFSDVSKPGYTTPVAKGLYILDTYKDSIYREILTRPLSGNKTYKYSDVGYYFLRQIIQKETDEMENDFVLHHFYSPMGLHTMRYLPLNYMNEEVIAPTENDQVFRKRQIRGYVHDQGAAMLGGVGGHAGLFSNSTDLGALMQMYLNGGEYGGIRYLKKEVLDEYTACQFCPGNRRGAGFDKPVRTLDGGPTCNLVSLSSFGHSGFTGTLTWADPAYGINYVFLSNSVYPSAENKKLLHMGQRTKIQEVIYKAIIKAKK